MFKLYFTYNGKDIAVTDCYGFFLSTGKRKLYVKRMENGHIVTHSYFTELIENFMFSF